MRARDLGQPTWRDRLAGAPMVALVGGLSLVVIVGLVLWVHPPAQERASIRERCRALFAAARTPADSVKADLTVVVPGASRTANRDENCRELRLRGELAQLP